MSSELIELKSNYKNILRVGYMMSNVCNYSCDYCFPGSHEGTHQFKMDWQLAAKNLNHMFGYYIEHSDKSKFNLQIAGGEPTLWPDLPNFCNAVRDGYRVSIMIISNGSRTHRWWQEHGDCFDHVVLSCHHKEVDIDHFMEVANILYRKNVKVSVVVMMDPTAWDKCTSLVETLKDSKYKWPLFVQKLEGNYTYNEHQAEYLKKSTVRIGSLVHLFKTMHRAYGYQQEPVATFSYGHTKQLTAHEVSLNGWNNFYGWNCNLGVDSVYVNLDGNITGTCNQKPYGLDFYHNIYDENFSETFTPNIKPTICKSIICGCVDEINMTKRKVIHLVPISSTVCLPHKYSSF